MRKDSILRGDTIIALLLVALLMAMSITHNVLFFYSVLALSLVRITKPMVIFPVYFVASLSTEWFGLGIGVSAGRYLSVILIVSLFIELIFKRNSRPSNALVSVLFFIFYCLICTILSVTGSFTPFFIILQSLIILLLFTVRKNDDIDTLYVTFYCTAIMVLAGVIVVIMNVGLAEFALYRMGQIEDIETNSNRVAMMIAQVGAVFGCDFSIKKFKGTGWISLIFLFLSVFVIILTGSRTGLISIVITTIMMYFFQNGLKFKRFVIPALAIAVTLYFALDFLNEMEIAGLDRMSAQEVIESGGTDRYRAIKIMWNDVFPNYPIFGVGLGGENFVKVALAYGVDHACHNIVFDSLCQMGLIGFVSFLAVIIPLFNKTFLIYKTEKSPICALGLALFFAACINGIGETVYIEKLFWNALTLCVICCGHFRYSTKFKRFFNTKRIENGQI